MTRWSYNLVKIRLAAIRAAMTPRDFARTSRVPIVVGEAHTVEVAIESVEGTCFGGRRRWLRCPNGTCARKTVVIGFDPFTGEFGCRACMHWRSRVATPGPHTRASLQIRR